MPPTYLASFTLQTKGAEALTLVKLARVARNLSQAQLAQRLSRSRATIQSLEETGTTDRTLAMAATIVLGLPQSEDCFRSIMEGNKYETWRVTPMDSVQPVSPEVQSV